MISHVTIKNLSMNANAADISATLKGLNFFTSSKICLFPMYENGNFTYTAYIKVAEWMDCDMAYTVVKAIKDGKNPVAYIKETQELWNLEKTAAANISYTEDARYLKWSTEFDKVDSDTESDYSEYEADVEAITNAKVGAPETDFSAFSRF